METELVAFAVGCGCGSATASLLWWVAGLLFGGDE
jgi:hypothetical protein